MRQRWLMAILAVSSLAVGCVREPWQPVPPVAGVPKGPALADIDYADRNWICVGGDRGCSRYSQLAQINRSNVDQLEVAWTFHTGEVKNGVGRTIECTPVVVNERMYVSTADRRVVALNASTGAVLWDFDPLTVGPPIGPLASGGVNRGVAYWCDRPDDPSAGVERILHGTSDGRLFAIDAKTGKLDRQFGNAGVKDLRADLDVNIANLPYGPTSAPAIVGNLVVLGFSNGEGPEIAAPGDIRAFDVRTGKPAWTFHTVPRPGEFGNDQWPNDSWKNRGGANAWGGISVDTQHNLVFAGLGSASFDFFGGDRPGDNLFANCTLALDATTGQRRWHFQTLRHDLWDHDLPTYPNVIAIRKGNQITPAVAQVTKTGYVYLFDRLTGKPLFDVIDKPVVATGVPGEVPSPTQPIPVAPPAFSEQSFDESNVTNIAPANRAYVLDKLKTLRRGPAFQPPSFEGTVVIPGFHGGANWSGASFDPETNLLYVNSTNQPNIMALKPAKDGAKYRYDHKGYVTFNDQEGYPAIAPPWGQLNAIDLATGRFAWRSILGEYPELTKRGVPQTGTENFGGTIVTAGGLVFIGGTKDEKFRAFDKQSGKVLWEAQLPAGGYATPATYSAGGEQYVVIAAGGAGKLRTRPGDAFVAFRLKRKAGSKN
ncbi:MAG: pyrroloquinoline quinone-dependent dehydrogenase [Gemmataceae bacterium]